MLEETELEQANRELEHLTVKAELANINYELARRKLKWFPYMSGLEILYYAAQTVGWSAVAYYFWTLK